ncbi:MAG: RNA polymerase sigma-70 factor [Bacteroidales bacterium]|nr:RNA polymerase sigma-70 factor [Bacteroidales bacterium]MBR1434100.1 RNA polymerase sigma-70 factor [Bacteroidales bacterium]
MSDIYKRYYRPLCLYALHYMGDVDESEDVVQECLTSVWQNGTVVSNGKSYLYTTVRNRCIDRLRSKGRIDVVPMDDVSEISDEEAQARSEREALLWTAVDSLPAKRRKILLMSKRDGLKYEEIALRLGISENTVRNQISRALETLRSKASDILYFFFGF